MNENEVPVLRPLNGTDIVDETIDLYRANFQLIILISAIFVVPASVIGYLIGSFLNAIIPDAFTQFATMEALAATPFSMIASTITTAALTYAISRRYLSKPVTAYEAYTVTVQKILPIIGTAIIVWVIGLALYIVAALVFTAGAVLTEMESLAGIAVMILGGLLFLAGIFWLIACVPLISLSTPTLMVENSAYLANVKRTWKLISGKRSRYLGVLILAILLSMIASFPASILSEFMTGKNFIFSGLAGLINGLITAVTLPLTLIPAVLLYFDARVRDEGLDILILAREAGYETGENIPS